MSRDIKSTAMVLKALAHLRSKGFEFHLIANSILHKVEKRRVAGLAIYHRSGGALESPLVAIHNHLYLPNGKGVHASSDYHIDAWSLPEEEQVAIRQASCDSPYSDPGLRSQLLKACGLKEVPIHQRPFLKRPSK